MLVTLSSNKNPIFSPQAQTTGHLLNKQPDLLLLTTVDAQTLKLLLSGQPGLAAELTAALLTP